MDSGIAIRKVFTQTLLLCSLVILAGCRVEQPRPPNPTPFETEAPLIDAQALPISDLPAAQSVRTLLAQQLQVEASEVEIVEAEEVTWRDTCLGLPVENRPCVETDTPGYLITAEVTGQTFIYRTDQRGAEVRLVEAPDVEEQPIGLEWQDETQRGCWRADITMQTVAFGPCSAELMPGSYVDPIRMVDLLTFIDTYQSFDAETPAGSVRFQGRGEQQATPIEERMIAEWAAVTVAETESGQAGTGFGAVLVWARINADERQESLQLYASGEAIATLCDDNGRNCDEPVRVRMEAGDLLIVYDLVDTYESFEAGLNSPIPPITMFFTGRGDTPAPQAERTLIQDYAQEMFEKVYEQSLQ